MPTKVNGKENPQKDRKHNHQATGINDEVFVQ